ncbi:hypothetical protein [Candidatus Colwellia aromaticivorans]|uniref:hypothetical protein n=1 Tax=Candidatus Colwellia aromaticivorans TaxID=2267621 RepID=UPI000DF11061|nr:hypothetical protein [Candidatus Colwellia aromaticivorans]
MSLTLDNVVGKSCLIGLSYFDKQGEMLKQSMLGGIVKSVDKEMGITIELAQASSENKKHEKAADFLIPSILTCWFVAPKGEFHTSTDGVKLVNPDYLVTWDIHQSKDKGEVSEGEQQWWEWVPRTAEPQVDK